MKTLHVLALLGALLSCPPAWADDDDAGDAQKRFHDAYVEEVIEGKVAEAARAYLALMEEDGVGARLAAEARFRFAICAVLLGRADEGRTHLAALIADPETPAALKTRAETYRRTVSEIGVGKELDRKLQELVFDLGRAGQGSAGEGVYRDFEIIGRSAVPFLKKLLLHSDERLRRHAFRLLCRLDEPGMGSTWTPALHAPQRQFATDLVAYLKRHPQEQDALEKRVPELGEAAWQRVRHMSPWPAWSLDFVRAFAKTRIAPSAAVAWLEPVDDARFDLLRSWTDGDDEALAGQALIWLLKVGLENEKADAAFQRKALERLLAWKPGSYGWPQAGTLGRFSRLTQRQTPEHVLDSLEAIVRDVEENGGLVYERPAAAMLFDPVANAFDKRAERPSPAAHRRYAALLERWLASWLVSDEARKRDAREGKGHILAPPPLAHLRVALGGMAEADALATVRRLFAAPGRAHYAQWGAVLPKAHDGRSVRLLAAAIGAAAVGERWMLLKRLPFESTGEPPPASYLDAVDEAIVRLLPSLNRGEIVGLLEPYAWYALHREPEAALEAVARLLEAARTLSPDHREAALNRILRSEWDVFEKTVAPLAAARWAWLDERERGRVLEAAFHLLKAHGDNTSLGGDAIRASAASVIAPHVDEVDPPRLLFRLLDHPELFPLETWLGQAPPMPSRFDRDRAAALAKLSVEDVDRVVAHLTKDSARVNESVLHFVRSRASEQTSERVFDAFLVSPSAERRTLVLGLMDESGWPASTAALEEAIALELAAEPVDVRRLRRAGGMLLKRKPSEKLFPVARRLLRSDEASDVAYGLRMADSLGRQDLVADILPHLRSMDVEIRTLAQQTLAAINAVARIEAQTPKKK